MSKRSTFNVDRNVTVNVNGKGYPEAALLS